MLLVIFGAGASHASTIDTRVIQQVQDGVHRAPPLAKDLVDPAFDPLADEIPQCRPIISLLRERLAHEEPTSLEVALAEIAERSRQSLPRRRQLVAFRFHLHRLIQTVVDAEWGHEVTHGQTNYVNLLNYLLDWQEETKQRVLLASFNYDTLLDSAASDVVTGWTFETLPSYIERPDFRLFKLHGSTGWCRALTEPSSAGLSARRELIDRALPLDPSIGDIRAHPPHEAIDQNGTVEFPAMAIPLADKTTFECPDDHLKALRRDLREVTRVLIIGWRGAEPHAVNLLGSLSRQALFGIVTGGPTGYRELLGNLGKIEEGFLEEEGFSAFTRRLRQHLATFLPR